MASINFNFVFADTISPPSASLLPRQCSLPHPAILRSLKRHRFPSSRRSDSEGPRFSAALASSAGFAPKRNGTYKVGEFMTKKEDLNVVKTTTSVDEALEILVGRRISGLPVIDDDWNLVGVVSDYDLLALDSISGSVWKLNVAVKATITYSLKSIALGKYAFNEIQKLLSKTKGKVIGDLMTPAPLVVQESTNLEDAARLLLETRYRRLPVVDDNGRLVGLITRGSIVRAALHTKYAAKST